MGSDNKTYTTSGFHIKRSQREEVDKWRRFFGKGIRGERVE